MNSQDFNNKLTKEKVPLKNFAYHLTADKDDAEDLLQETFLKALKNKDKFLSYSYQNMKPWLFTIMKNTFINAYRSASRKAKINDYSEENSFINSTTEQHSSNPEEVYHAKEVHEKLDELEFKFRTPLQLFLEGYRYDEIAKKLNLKIGTVKSRIFFTRQKLKNKLELVA